MAVPTPGAAAAGRGDPWRESNATATAYREVKRRILDNEYAPGALISVQELALALGMSRTPIRDALIRLEKEELVELVPRHGVRIPPVSPDDMREIYEILAGLESVAVELILQRDPGPDELEPLARAVGRMERALAADDLDAWGAADEAFHHEMVRLAGNRRLAAIVGGFRDKTHRARRLTLRLRPKPVESTAQHPHLVEAIRRRDAAAARRVHWAQRLRSGRELTEILRRYAITQL